MAVNNHHSLGLLLGGAVSHNGGITEEIDILRKEIEEKNEAIATLNKDVEKLQELNEDLTSTVELKDKEIKPRRPKSRNWKMRRRSWRRS